MYESKGRIRIDVCVDSIKDERIKKILQDKIKDLQDLDFPENILNFVETALRYPTFMNIEHAKNCYFDITNENASLDYVEYLYILDIDQVAYILDSKEKGTVSCDLLEQRLIEMASLKTKYVIPEHLWKFIRSDESKMILRLKDCGYDLILDSIEDLNPYVGKVGKYKLHYYPFREEVLESFEDRVTEWGFKFYNHTEDNEEFKRFLLVIDIRDKNEKKIFKEVSKILKEIRKESDHCEIRKAYADEKSLMYVVNL